MGASGSERNVQAPPHSSAACVNLPIMRVVTQSSSCCAEAASTISDWTIVDASYRDDLRAVPTSANWAKRLCKALDCCHAATWSDPVVHDEGDFDKQDGAGRFWRPLVSRETCMLALQVRVPAHRRLSRGLWCVCGGGGVLEVVGRAAITRGHHGK